MASGNVGDREISLISSASLRNFPLSNLGLPQASV